MNLDEMKGKWKELKGNVRKQWGKLTDDEIDEIAGNVEALQGKLQQRYGWEKEKAKKAVDEFRKSLH